MSLPEGRLVLTAPAPGTSFTEFLTNQGYRNRWELPEAADQVSFTEATTVLALQYREGVLMAGDRQATDGVAVSHRSLQKVFAADAFSAVAIAGAAGPALEMVRLFQVELEHYEKIEGVGLSLEGKANFLARLVRGHFPLARQGLVVVPLFAGYDQRGEEGRLYSFDVVGGRYEESEYSATGSGGRLAKSYLRATFRKGLEETEAVGLTMRALVSAAEEDLGTGGPDLRRGIFPTVLTVGTDGVRELPDSVLEPHARQAWDEI